MATFPRGIKLRVAATAPLVALGYAAIALTVVRVGCSPPFADTLFFDVPVTFFLLLALTVTALILIVFAAITAWRTWRVMRRRRRGDDEAAARAGFIGVWLAAFAFVASGSLGAALLLRPCS